MIHCYLCGGNKPFIQYYCDDCSTIRRYVMIFGTKGILGAIKTIYIKDDVPVGPASDSQEQAQPDKQKRKDR